MSAPVPASPNDHPSVGPLTSHVPTRAAAALAMGVAGMGIWAPLFGSGVLWAAPILAWAMLILTRVVAPASLSGRLAVGLSWLPWIPIAGLLVGLPASVLDPTAAGESARQFLDGIRHAVDGSEGPWALTAWLTLVGVFWVRGAANAIRPGNGPAAWGFIYFAAPFVCGMLVGRTEDAAWHGAVLLIGALLWATAGTLRGSLAALVVVGIVATIAGSASGFTERQVQFGGERKQTGEVNWGLDYGPDQSPHVGALFLEVQAERPALWRAEVLERWDGRTWRTSLREPASDLPQPAAVATTTNVTVRKLRDVRAVAPGRITSLTVPPPLTASRVATGEGAHFQQVPAAGTQYAVTSEVVEASAEDLAAVRIPRTGEYLEQTQLWSELPDGLEAPIARHASRMSEDLRRTSFGQVVTLAHGLASGTRSQLEVVRRVQAYLTDPSRFSYTRTDVAPAGDQEPLLTFLTRTRRGYCQHFAGSAALLLRMTGIPARVAVGFGTGKQVGDGRFRVEDSDAHAWIEVYFEGYGWVPFNPTPAAADVRIGDGVDELADAASSGPPAAASRTVGLVLLGLITLLGAVLLVRRLRRRSAGGGVALADLLMRLAPAPTRPAMTLGSIAPALERIGPATAALRVVAERERFDPAGAAVARPRRVLWRALRQDAGPWRAARLLLFGAAG